MLKDTDVLIFDIQDVGTQYYTYIYTMAYAMEAAKEKGIPFMSWTGRIRKADEIRTVRFLNRITHHLSDCIRSR